MRRLLPFLALLLLLVCPAHAALSVVAIASGADNGGGGDATIATSSTLTVGTGQLLIVSCYAYSMTGAGTITVSDSASTNTFLPSPDGLISTTGNDNIETFYAKNTIAKSSDTITCNFNSTGSFVSIAVIQVSGADTTTPLDTHATGTYSSSSSPTSNAFTTTSANELVYAAFGTHNNITSVGAPTGTIGGSSATIQNLPSDSGIVLLADETQITTGTITGGTAVLAPDMTAISGNMQVLTFKQASAGAASGAGIGGKAGTGGKAGIG